MQDTLIRLFPGQFWVDAGIVIGALVLLAALLTLILTWPTRKRRGLPPRGRNASAAEDAGRTCAADPAELKGRRFKRSRNGAVDEPRRPRRRRRHRRRQQRSGSRPAAKGASEAGASSRTQSSTRTRPGETKAAGTRCRPLLRAPLPGAASLAVDPVDLGLEITHDGGALELQ